MVIDLRPKRTVQELDNGIKVYQNFMRESDFQKFLKFFERLPWFIDNIYNSSVPEEYQDQNFLPHQDFEPDPKHNTQLSHFLFHVEQGEFPTTELQKELFSAIFSNIGTIFDVYAWVRIKANITFCTEHIIEHGFHVDRMPLTPLSESQTTAVLHLDNSDGYTKFFQDDIKITSKPNQLITFPSHLYHTGTTCTDQDKRQVLNLNFFGTPC